MASDIILKLDEDSAKLQVALIDARIQALDVQIEELYVKLDPLRDERDAYEAMKMSIYSQLNKKPTISVRQIAQSTRSVTNAKTDLSIYSSGWSLALKTEYILNKANTELTTRQIIDKFLELEPLYLNVKDIAYDRLQKNLGSTLKQKIDQKNTFYRHKLNEDGHEWLYGLIEWKNDKNKEAALGAA